MLSFPHNKRQTSNKTWRREQRNSWTRGNSEALFYERGRWKWPIYLPRWPSELPPHFHGCSTRVHGSQGRASTPGLRSTFSSPRTPLPSLPPTNVTSLPVPPVSGTQLDFTPKTSLGILQNSCRGKVMCSDGFLLMSSTSSFGSRRLILHCVKWSHEW